MPHRSVACAVGICAAALSLIRATPLVAQEAARAGAPLARPAGTAVAVREAPMFDGQLTERAWLDAPPLTGFTQAEPFESQSASEQTEVRILYDDTAIYVGVTLHDSDPSQIVTTDTRRDADLREMDSFLIVFDTFRDRQNGFVFGTNALGVQYDAQVRNEGRPDATWDGSWDVRTNVTESGWTAEFRIPLRTLRYGPAPQIWGVNVFRNIQRSRERTYWAPLAREYNIERLSSAGDLRGLQLQTPRNLKVLPYLTSSANRDFRPGASTDLAGEFGFDAKFGITPSLNLDATYNTDFAQVEVDTQQINLTRFNLRFPEKRPFFQENAGLFRIGKGNELDLFFSRRIGLDENGHLVPIRGGGRLSGKANGFNVGAVNMQTDDVVSTPGNNFSVLRASRELRNRSGVGVMFVNRSATGSRARSDDWNRTWGTDARLGLGQHFDVGGFAARTETPGRTGRDYAWNVDSQWENSQHQMTFEWGVTGEDFNPEVGFLETPGGYRRFRVGAGEVMRQEKIRSWGFRELNPHVNYTRYDYLPPHRAGVRGGGPGPSGGLLTSELHLDNHWDWENGQFVTVALNGTWDGLREPFAVYPGVIVPAGEHGGLRATIRYNSDRRKWLYGRLQWDLGGFLTGTQSSPTMQLIIREGGRFTLDTTWNYRRIDLPQGAFHTNLGNMRVTYNFTPSVFVQSLLQYNDRTDRWSTNLRFHWLQTAGTGLFLVYNDTEALNGFGPINRAFIVKYVRQFDLLR
ncbi:MAG: carbohydrate binding family 9 domain-containing protein [Acidobacteria bacterium]|nr:carbohydrate binding family 9 domain-containing protein [Acidobacteriota bacterium]